MTGSRPSSPMGIFQSNIQENKDWNSAYTHSTRCPRTCFQSNIQENKDWNSIRSIFRIHPPLYFQSNIQENKDWNSKLFVKSKNFFTALSEQHPREQGLKHDDIDKQIQQWYTFRATSKRTRIETSHRSRPGEPSFPPFRATSKRTRIETWDNRESMIGILKLSEQHPREQGLKLSNAQMVDLECILSEQHPREQGLKLQYIISALTLYKSFRATSKRTRIETRKDL